LESLCPTRRGGWQNKIPTARRKPKMESKHEVAVVIQRRGKILLRKCGDGERWAGLWDFPRFAFDAKSRRNKASIEHQLTKGVLQLTGIKVSEPQQFATLRHGVTRFRITLEGFAATCTDRTKRVREGEAPAEPSRYVAGKLRWITPQELDDYPLNTTGRKLARLWHEQSTASKK
jgi:A/G-specific adenine glycosylase